MRDFKGRIAVVTGGGSGIGRELVRQLAAEGCSVAMCDIAANTMDETWALCQADGVPDGAIVTCHLVDVSDEDQVLRFRREVADQLATDMIHLLFNNAGIGGVCSMFTDSRAAWDKTFAVCWGGVYYMTRAFLPMLFKASEGHIANTSSVNGFWAMYDPATAHTAYSTAKFAVKGFTEALITDLRVNAPHIKCSLVMPGHIGTNIVANSRAALCGLDSQNRADIEALAAKYRDSAPMSAAQAASVILDAVRAERWRVLVGKDAELADELVRREPERAYEPDFLAAFVPSDHAAW